MRELQSFSFNNISVRLFVPQLPGRRELQAAHSAGGAEPAPYWAKLWPSAIALSQYIADHPELVAGKEVLELAAGLGLPGLVTAHIASTVVISDYMPQALPVMGSSIAANRLDNVRCRLLDWNALPAGLEPDVLLLSDISYDPSAFDKLHSVLLGFLAKGTTILLATPQRLMAKSFIGRLMPYCLAQEEQEISLNGESAFISVFVLR